MKANRSMWNWSLLPGTSNLAIAWVLSGYLAGLVNTEAATNVVLWDTRTAFSESADPQGRSNWKAVPPDLLSLETDPPKASSDPGYYGREYTFRGDAVIENRQLTALCWAGKGKVLLYVKPSVGGGASDANRGGQKLLELAPIERNDHPTTIDHYSIVRNANDEVALDVVFRTQGAPDLPITLSLGRSDVLEIKPAAPCKGVTLTSVVDYAVVPSFIGDDLIYSASKYPGATELSVPAENMLLGLVRGEGAEFVMTWPNGRQRIKLGVGGEIDGIHSINFENDGQSVFVAALTAPGIWHKETLSGAYLEKDVPLKWKRPFAAKWKTQLTEADVPTTFTFREAKGTVWRGVPGSYNYPVWFNGDYALYHLSKKVPPKGESLIYFTEGNDTPLGIATPADLLQETLGRPMAEPILDFAGRKLRTHHRRGGNGVRRACTCGCTEAIQAYFELGEETDHKQEIDGALEDMIYFVQQHVARINEYRRFADDILKLLRAQENASPPLQSYLQSLEQIAQQIPQEYEVQKENMKSLSYAQELAQKTRTLAAKKGPDNLKVYMDLLKDWRAMGGAQDYVVAQCHMITRKLAQQAGYAVATEPAGVSLAQELRSRCRACLRNPDGYEIWANY